MNYSQIMSPHPPLPRKVGGHDPPGPMGAPPLNEKLCEKKKKYGRKSRTVAVAVRLRSTPCVVTCNIFVLYCSWQS